MKRLAMVLAILGFLASAGSALADCGSCEKDGKVAQETTR